MVHLCYICNLWWWGGHLYFYVQTILMVSLFHLFFRVAKNIISNTKLHDQPADITGADMVPDERRKQNVKETTVPEFSPNPIPDDPQNKMKKPAQRGNGSNHFKQVHLMNDSPNTLMWKTNHASSNKECTRYWSFQNVSALDFGHFRRSDTE